MNNQREPIRPTGTDSARLVTLIMTEAKRGSGVPGDLHRIVREYWTLTGEKVAEYDSVRDPDSAACCTYTNDGSVVSSKCQP